MRRRIRSVVGLGVWLGLACACARPATTPEEELRATVAAVLAAVEESDPAPILERLSPSFRSEATATQPSLDYGAVRSLVLEFLMPGEPLGARSTGLRIHPEQAGGARRVELEVWFARGRSLGDGESPLPPGAVRYRFDLVFAPHDGQWRAEGGSFERVGGA